MRHILNLILIISLFSTTVMAGLPLDEILPEIVHVKTPRELKQHVDKKNEGELLRIEIDVPFSTDTNNVYRNSDEPTILPTHMNLFESWSFEGVDELYITAYNEYTIRPHLSKFKTQQKVVFLFQSTVNQKNLSEELKRTFNTELPHFEIINASGFPPGRCSNIVRLSACDLCPQWDRYDKSSYPPFVLNSALYIIQKRMSRKTRNSILTGLTKCASEERIRVAQLVRNFMTEACKQSHCDQEDDNYELLLHSLSMITDEAGRHILKMLEEDFLFRLNNIDLTLPWILAFQVKKEDILPGYAFDSYSLQIENPEKALKTYKKFREKSLISGSDKDINILRLIATTDERAEAFYEDVLVPLPSIKNRFLSSYVEYDRSSVQWAVKILSSHLQELKHEDGRYICSLEYILEYILDLPKDDQTDENALYYLKLFKAGYIPFDTNDHLDAKLVKDMLEVAEVLERKHNATMTFSAFKSLEDDLRKLTSHADRTDIYLTFPHDWVIPGRSRENRVNVNPLTKLKPRFMKPALKAIRQSIKNLVHYETTIAVIDAILADYSLRKDSSMERQDDNSEEEYEEQLYDETLEEVEEQEQDSLISKWKSYDFKTRNKNNKLIRKKLKDNIPVENWPHELQEYWVVHPEPSSLRKTPRGKRHRKKKS